MYGYNSNAPPTFGSLCSPLLFALRSYLAEHPGAEKPSPEGLARAHDKTRWTPHPTINLLRPRQLNIAKEVDVKEKRAKVRRPTNRVVLTLQY